MTVVLNDARRITLDKDEIESITPSSVSLMPEGLLNNLSLEQIQQLFDYLEQVPDTAITSRREATSTR